MRINIHKTLLALEKRHWFVFFGILFRVVLELGYSEFVVPFFSYSGYVLDLEMVKYVESWILFVFMLFLFPRHLKRPSDYLMVYMFFVFLTPLLCFYGLSNQNRNHLYSVLFCVLLISIFRIGKPLNIRTVVSGKKVAIYFLTMGSFFVTAWMFYRGGFSYFNLDLTKVYDFRGDVGPTINVGIMGYINIWATKVFGPALLALSLWRKKYFYSLLIIGLHVVWFGVSSHKSVLFYPALVTFLYFWFKNTRALSLVPIGLSLPVLVSFLAYVGINEVFMGSLFIRRVFFVPASLTFTYFEFFSANPFVYWSNNITSAFINYPYDLNTAKLIGNYLGTGVSANNSFLATGYMHAGMVGVALYGIIAGLLFRLVDTFSAKGIPHWVALSVLIVPSQSLITSADLPTSLLTHGFGMSLLVLFFLRSRGLEYDRSYKIRPLPIHPKRVL